VNGSKFHFQRNLPSNSSINESSKPLNEKHPSYSASNRGFSSETQIKNLSLSNYRSIKRTDCSPATKCSSEDQDELVPTPGEQSKLASNQGKQLFPNIFASWKRTETIPRPRLDLPNQKSSISPHNFLSSPLQTFLKNSQKEQQRRTFDSLLVDIQNWLTTNSRLKPGYENERITPRFPEDPLSEKLETRTVYLTTIYDSQSNKKQRRLCQQSPFDLVRHENAVPTDPRSTKNDRFPTKVRKRTTLYQE
jgi:hypothetical protein